MASSHWCSGLWRQDKWNISTGILPRKWRDITGKIVESDLKLRTNKQNKRRNMLSIILLDLDDILTDVSVHVL